MKITVGEEHVIVQGIRPEEELWGSYQFPVPYAADDGIFVSVHMSQDNILTFGTRRWFKSTDEGLSWQEVSPSVGQRCGLALPNGDRIAFPQEPALDVSGYTQPDWHRYTPDYDFSKAAAEGTLPLPDGMTYWLDGTVIKAYRADRLPPSLSGSRWTMHRTPSGQAEPVTEQVPVDWPELTRVVYTGAAYSGAMKSIFPQGTPKLAPDGSVWITAYSGEGHIAPATDRYSPYYSAEIFRSDDNCRSFRRQAHMEYEADGHRYPYQSGGFSDSDFAFMPDGSVVWFLRSTWAMSTGREWDPMYMTRSADGGQTWSDPLPFAHTGIYPQLCTLGCGAVLLCYARPGMFVQGCDDGHGLRWTDPITVMTPEDRSSLANIPIKDPLFHEWDGSCNNPTLLPLDDHSALLFYSDFYYPDPTGVKRKTILCRKLTVQ